MLATAWLAITVLAAGGDTTRGPVRAVAEVDLERYAGRWFEIARLPNSFQKDCVAGETTADYALLPDRQIRVVNSCVRPDGSINRAEGRARLAKGDGPTSKLKVRFAPGFLAFLPLVWGDYWILDLTDDYGAVLVGEPSRKYLWILARSPELDDVTYRRLVSTAVAQGFDVTRLLRSPAAGAQTREVVR